MQTQMEGNVHIGTTDNFEKLVLSSATPVVVDFWAPWCVWCRRLAPTYAEMATKFAKQLTFVKVNVEEEAAVAERFGIMSLPTLKYFCAGREISEQVGAPPRDRLEAGFLDVIKNHKECLATSSAMRS